MKGYPVDIGYMGYIPGVGYSLFSTELEYIETFMEMIGCNPDF